MPYAEGTSVSPEKTLSEIRATLKRYDATSFSMAEQPNKIGIQFDMHGCRARFVTPLPNRKDYERTPGRGLYRTTEQVDAAYEKATRERWRALLLVIKAKLESVESGIETFEEAFQAQLVLPSGETFGEWAAPQIERIYAENAMPPLLPG